jgi:sporulation protein YlmC with PRC-barrel domain
MIKKIATAAVFGFLTISAVAAQGTARLQASIPGNALTVTDWYKQDVYDPNNAKIGQIMDVLVDKSGKISTLIIGVGGFLGAGEKDVAVPFGEVQATTKDNKIHLVMNTSKDALKSAPGFRYDSSTTTWVHDKQ